MRYITEGRCAQPTSCREDQGVVRSQDGNGDETHRVLLAQTHPHEKIANRSPSPPMYAGLKFCPSPKPVGFSKPTGNPSHEQSMKTTTFERRTGAYSSSRRWLGDLGLGLGVVLCGRERGLKSERQCSDRARGWFVLQGLDAVGLGCSGTVSLGHLSQDGLVHAK